MKQKDLQVGGTYLAKVSGKMAKVLIVREHVQTSGRLGWYGRNLATAREVFIRSAARLRHAANDSPKTSISALCPQADDAQKSLTFENRAFPATPVSTEDTVDSVPKYPN
jgi:hypothetical protein